MDKIILWGFVVLIIVGLFNFANTISHTNVMGASANNNQTTLPSIVPTVVPIDSTIPTDEISVEPSDSPIPTDIPTNQPTPTPSVPLIDCTGPDGKHLQVTQQQCDNFNAAWGNNPTPTQSTTYSPNSGSSYVPVKYIPYYVPQAPIYYNPPPQMPQAISCTSNSIFGTVYTNCN